MTARHHDHQQGRHREHRDDDRLRAADRDDVLGDDRPHHRPAHGVTSAGSASRVGTGGMRAGRDARLDREVHVLERRRLGLGAVHVRRRAPRAGGRGAAPPRGRSTRTSAPSGVGATIDTPRLARSGVGGGGVDRAAELELRVDAVPQARGDLLRPAEGVQHAAVEHRHAVGQAAGLAEEVGAEHDGAAVLGGQRADQVDDVAGGGRVEARRRLVEEQHVGVVEERPRQREPLALPGRGALHGEVGAVGHAEPLEQLVGALLHGAPVEARACGR